MPNLAKLIWYFYRPIIVWNVAFSLACTSLIAIWGFKVAGFVLFLKLTGYASTIFLQGYTAKNRYMFYRNAGYGITQMYTYVFGIDFLIYVVMLTVLAYRQ